MNWMDHSMGWSWMLLIWIVSVLLIVGLVNILAHLMDHESPGENVSKQCSLVTTWFSGLRTQFNDWRRANAEAHAKSKPGACCAAQPPGAGSQPHHGTGMR